MVKVVQIYPPGYEVSRLLCVEKTLKSTVRSSPPAASNRHIISLVHLMTSAMQEYFENRNSTHNHGTNRKLVLLLVNHPTAKFITSIVFK